MSRRRFGPSLELNAVALMVATASTGLFGLVFWTVAARNYEPAEVGRASAVLSTAAMFSVLASYNIGLVFTRILAAAGAKSRSMVLAGYGAAAVVAAVFSAGFVLFIPSSDALFTSGTDRLLFCVFVVVLGIFVLQDWVLIGIRAATWVPVEQFAFAVLKLGLLVVFAVMLPGGGIVLSWALSAALAVLIISPLLLIRVLPNRSAPMEHAIAMPTRRGLALIFVAEYATGAMTIIVPLVLPLIVVSQLGTQDNAYYALPWTIAGALNVLVWNICSSYMVEASNDGSRTPVLLHRAFRLAALVAGLGVPSLLVAGPWLLSFAGGAYSAEGSGVLRLMALAVPFTIMTTLYVCTSRVRHQMGRVVAIQLLTAATVITLALLFIGPFGITGVGMAYLSAEVLASAAVIVPLIRFMKANRLSLLRKPERIQEADPVTVSST